jgi:hypothetical protein
VFVSSGGCCPIWSSDGTRILVQVSSPSGDLWISDRSGNLTQVTHENGSFDGFFDAYLWGRLP